MCTTSAIIDNQRDVWVDRYPWIVPNPSLPYNPPPVEVSKEDFEALRREVEELKKLIKAAKDYDEATGQKDCESHDKIQLLKQIAEALGVELEL